MPLNHLWGLLFEDNACDSDNRTDNVVNDHLMSLIVEAEEEENKLRCQFLQLPNEVILLIWKWTDFESREALRDVCRRFRFLVDQEETAISLRFLTHTRMQSLDSRTFCKYFNLRTLDLVLISRTSMQHTMTNTRTRTLFANQMATSCPLIDELRVQGIVGCKWLNTYCKQLGTECRIKKLHVDMVQGYIGCMETLNQSLPLLRHLTSLSVTCSAIRPSLRFHSLTSRFFDQLGSRLTSFVSSFPPYQNEVDAIAVPRLSELEVLKTGTLSAQQVLSVHERNPRLRDFRLGVSTDTVSSLPIFKEIERLSLTMRSQIPHRLIQSAIKSFPRLQVLEITFSHFTNEPFNLGIGHCPGLRVLIVNGMPHESFMAAVRHLPGLRTIIAPYWAGPSDATSLVDRISKEETAVQSLLLSCPLLEKVETSSSRFLRKGSSFESHKRQFTLHSRRLLEEKYFPV